jgi:predicted Zn-dependent peptidase
MNPSEIKVKFEEEKLNKSGKIKEKRKINQSYVVLGYKTPKRNEFDSYVLDVIRAVLGRGLSGKLFRTIRTDRGLAYDVGIFNDPNIDYGVFAAYFSTNKKNVDNCIKLTLEEFRNLKKITKKELVEAKQFIEGDFLLDNEDSQSLANTLGGWEFASKAEDCDNYIDKIKKVTKKDIVRVVDKYLTKNYSLAIIEQK